MWKNQPEGEATLMTVAILKQVFEGTNPRLCGESCDSHSCKAAPALGSSCHYEVAESVAQIQEKTIPFTSTHFVVCTAYSDNKGIESN